MTSEAMPFMVFSGADGARDVGDGSADVPVGRGQERPLDRRAAETLARALRTVADPTRLQLLSMINGSPGQQATVGDLTEYLGLTQPTVSHHLRLMFEDGLLEREPRGRQVWYSITADRRTAIADLLR